MPKLIRHLTEAEIRNAKPRANGYKLNDGEGLKLLIRPGGTKVWQLHYSIRGKANVFTIGDYPQIGAGEARKIRDETKAIIKQGTDPNRQKQVRKWANSAPSTRSFEYLAREWFERQPWVPKHKKNIIKTFEGDVFPVIGNLAVEQIKPPDIIYILEKILKRDAPDIAKRVSQHSARVFDYAINKGICEYNPALGRSKIIPSRPVEHRPHLRAEQIPEFLEKLDAYHGGKLVQLAIRLLLLTFVRPGELRNAVWSEFDLNNGIWKIPASRMKMRREHWVPLSTQAMLVIREIQNISGRGELLFPGLRGATKPISDVTLLKAFQIMGYTGEKKIVPHGLRATASTILNEHDFNRDHIELQLAHVEQNKIRGSYNHAQYLEPRKKMMQWWADYLDGAKSA